MEIARNGRGVLFLWAVLLAAPTPAQTIVSRIDLSAPFAARPGLRFMAFQGPGTADDFESGGRAPGPIRLCVSPDGGRSCHPDLSHLLDFDTGPDNDSVPHFLNQVRIVQPRPGQALLLIQVRPAQRRRRSARGNRRLDL
jgi:hypothetical protein